MRLSTSTNIMEDAEKVFDVISLEECVVSLKEAGYKYIDINLAGQGRPGMPLTQDDWLEWAQRVREFADKLGVEFKQSHAYFYNQSDFSRPDRDWREELVRRSIIASGILGVEWMVMHPANMRDEVWYDPEAALRFNVEYHLPYVELAKKHNVGIAIENMLERGKMRRFSAHPDELIALVDEINDPSVGICWDFGHANVTGVNQPEALRRIGSWLKATHVADNHGEQDEHLPPFYGTVDWRGVMKALKDIGYAGDFAFEIQFFTDVLPGDLKLRHNLLKFTYDLGSYLLALE